MPTTDSAKKLNFDIRRSVLLGSYITDWGIPQSRVISSNEDTNRIEVLVFPDGKDNKITRIATVGLSEIERKDGTLTNYELLFVLPTDLGGATEEEVTNFLLDICVYSITEVSDFGVGTRIPPSDLAPSSWKLSAILVDEARGESEHFQKILIGQQEVELIWLIPIYKEEYFYIVEHGLKSFDECCDKSDFNLVDISRPAVV